MEPKLPKLTLQLEGEREISGQVVNISTGGLRLMVQSDHLPPPNPGENFFLQCSRVRKTPCSPMRIRYILPSEDQRKLILGLDFYPSKQVG